MPRVRLNKQGIATDTVPPSSAPAHTFAEPVRHRVETDAFGQVFHVTEETGGPIQPISQHISRTRMEGRIIDLVIDAVGERWCIDIECRGSVARRSYWRP